MNLREDERLLHRPVREEISEVREDIAGREYME
jgi:hypothetical protein